MPLQGRGRADPEDAPTQLLGQKVDLTPVQKHRVVSWARWGKRTKHLEATLVSPPCGEDRNPHKAAPKRPKRVRRRRRRPGARDGDPRQMQRRPLRERKAGAPRRPQEGGEARGPERARGWVLQAQHSPAQRAV